jgi:tRNA threonylcarbamoyl adenosine modification protein YjeE
MKLILEKTVLLDDLPEFTQQIAKDLKPKDVICLSGQLGSGKSTFSYHLFRYLGLSDDQVFSSPTFNLHNIYELPNRTVNHIDLYRLNTYLEFETLDLIPAFAAEDALTLIEWGDKFSECEALYTKKICFEYVDGVSEERLIRYYS